MRLLEQRLGQLECHARATQEFARIIAARLIGVENGERIGHAFALGQVVVGDDQIDTGAPRRISRSESTNPGIDADDQAHALRRSLLDHLVFHAIAVANAMGDVKVGDTTAHRDRGQQNHDGHRAVRVVIAIDENFFLTRDGGAQAFDCRAHATHQVRRVQMRKGRIEEALGVFRIANAAQHQQSRDCGQQLRLGETV